MPPKKKRLVDENQRSVSEMFARKNTVEDSTEATQESKHNIQINLLIAHENGCEIETKLLFNFDFYCIPGESSHRSVSEYEVEIERAVLVPVYLLQHRHDQHRRSDLN